jgi:hypothetical protein
MPSTRFSARVQVAARAEVLLDSSLCLYVDLLKRYKLLMKITIGLGLLAAVLLISVVYLLTR